MSALTWRRSLPILFEKKCEADMSSIRTPALGAAVLVGVAACGGGGSGTPGDQARSATTISTDNSVHAADASVSRNDDGRILLSITDGPMEGVSVFCEDATLGACQVVGGPANTSGEGSLINRSYGQFAFVGNFSIMKLVDGEKQGSTQLVHDANPDLGHTDVTLPEGTRNYSGQFTATADLADGPSGLVEGTASLAADFNTAVLGGSFTGSFDDATETRVTASFNNVTIDAANGQFTATDDTLILFQDREVSGDIDGAFYGPNASEAAGIFSFGGDDIGSMDGVFIACEGASASCIKH